VTDSARMLPHSRKVRHVVVQEEVQDGRPVQVEPLNLSAVLSALCVPQERPARLGRQIRLLRGKPTDRSRGQAASGSDVPEGHAITCTDVREGVRPFDGGALWDIGPDDKIAPSDLYLDVADRLLFPRQFVQLRAWSLPSLDPIPSELVMQRPRADP